jgi:hypothetical protein
VPPPIKTCAGANLCRPILARIGRGAHSDLRLGVVQVGEASSVTEPLDKYGETRYDIRDPDGYIIEVGGASRSLGAVEAR